ncbi:acyl-CoA dehydrogenase family protein, partial [Saccharopolyspora sp. 6M]|uniref:acyl-CoA dehydrogenase family protein n=1 Tax=Saccharopolyspora sp. 6M TaxID=2877237 RepID=UPI002101EB15
GGRGRGGGRPRRGGRPPPPPPPAAMKVTTDAVQVLGGAGYTRDFPAERYMREAKVLQIFEGTNQIQRMVIARDLAKG